MVAVMVCCLFCTNKHGPLTLYSLCFGTRGSFRSGRAFWLCTNQFFDCRPLNRLLCKHIMHLLFSSRPWLREHALTMDAGIATNFPHITHMPVACDFTFTFNLYIYPCRFTQCKRFNFWWPVQDPYLHLHRWTCYHCHLEERWGCDNS